MGSCSVHSHFEFLDTANALPNPLHKNKPDLARAMKAYVDAGYSHVAVTEHGSFSSYEDLREQNKEYKIGLQIIPAIEGYIQAEKYEGLNQEQSVLVRNEWDEDVTEILTKEDNYLYNGSHVILIAKDEIGYQSLVKVMNNSVMKTGKGSSKRMEIPVSVLKEYIEKGHVICTSACIGGLLGYPLNREFYMKKNHDKNKAFLEKYNYFELMKVAQEQEVLKELAKQKVKGKLTQAEKKLKAYLGTETESIFRDEVAHYQEIQEKAAMAKEELILRSEEFAQNEAAIKLANKHKCRSKYQDYINYQPLTSEERKENKDKLDKIYQTFSDIFGDDFYIELQNHHLEEEHSIYNSIVSYCEEKRVKEGLIPHYIQSNDIHICCTKDDPNVDKMIQARNMMKLVRMKIYDAFDEKDREYCIKTEEEITEDINALRNTYFDVFSGTEKESSITDEIVEESAKNTHILETINFEPKKANHYPAFEDAEALFDQKLAEGIKRRFNCTLEELPTEYRERILYEKDIMKTVNVIDYHLIVQEFLEFARYYGRIPEERRAEVEEFLDDTERIKKFVEDNNFPMATSTGVGRGSCGGSLICYCLNITEIDPIPYKLSMERYLNPERVSMAKLLILAIHCKRYYSAV